MYGYFLFVKQIVATWTTQFNFKCTLEQIQNKLKSEGVLLSVNII